MQKQPRQRWIIQIAVLIAVLTVPALASAQGCAMCYNNAAAANPTAIHALRSGILVLMIPPVLIFAAICLFALRNRNRFNDGNAAEEIPPCAGSQPLWIPVVTWDMTFTRERYRASVSERTDMNGRKNT